MTELKAPVKNVLRNPTTPAAVTRMWSRIEARERAAPRGAPPRRAWLLIAAVAVATSVAFAGITIGLRPVLRSNDAAPVARASRAQSRPPEPAAKPALAAPAPASPPAMPTPPAADAARAAASRAPAFRAPAGAIRSSPATSVQTSGESWRELAARGENAKAYAQLGQAGLASEARSASVADLFTLADVARLSGHPADAREPLARILAEHPGDGRASLAALTLGRIQLRSLGAPAAAATALEQALALGLPAGLGEDAYGLLVEARATAGDRAAARAAYADYAARFPESANGAEGATLRRWVTDP